MTIIDIIILIILAGFIFYGLFFGLIRTLGSLIGLVAGLWLTIIFYLTVFGWVKNLFFGHELAGKIIVFIMLFTLLNRLIGFIFALIDQTFNLLSIIPFLKTFNRLAGAVLGFVEGGLILGLILLFISETALAGRLDASKIAPFLISFAKAVTSLLPGVLERVKGMI